MPPVRHSRSGSVFTNSRTAVSDGGAAVLLLPFVSRDISLSVQFLICHAYVLSGTQLRAGMKQAHAVMVMSLFKATIPGKTAPGSAKCLACSGVRAMVPTGFPKFVNSFNCKIHGLFYFRVEYV